ncbi:efflux RND transporter periplasmic adaptor subunit [uncultured Alistipes sp.]|uniref:efflux RND transporter periplasmic adaptor subunit n=1 Tax=uncultured Alistipes sp. TaxID=538949 RepID=UPI0026072526|nr:efflux RND transporter periplasmic adaptor subunit [uncultured Alistipes sp.]
MKKISICAAAVSCMLMCGCQQKPMQQTVSEYEVLTVVPTDRTLSENYSASIRGRQDIDIYAQVSGKIAQLCVTEGQRVKKGQTLFIIDQVPYKAALQTAIANVEAAKAGVATAQLTYDSKKELFARNVVSQFDLSTAENALLTAKAQLAQVEAQEVNARNNLSYTVVSSPSDGVVGTLPFRVGSLVGPSTPTPLTTVSDNSEMYVYFSMTENQLLALTREYGSIDNTLKNMPDVRLQLNDGSMYDQPGRIESISGVIDTSTGSVQLRAAFPNKEGLLHSGGSGSLILPHHYTDCIVVPQSATFELQDKVYVYKVIDGIASSSMINVANISNGKEYIVNSGLSAGDVIVNEGVGLMREGTPVKPKNQQAAVTAPAADAAAAAQPETEKEE